jgi:ankyrin repeat protein
LPALLRQLKHSFARESDVDGEGLGLRLLLTAAKDDVEGLTVALESGAAVDFTADSDGATALMIASMAGHAECIRLLTDAGASAKLPNEKGRTPLMCAALRATPSARDACWPPARRWLTLMTPATPP